MLEQAELRAGMRVLEIGSGGYSAALIAALTSPGSHVVGLEPDPAVLARARRGLDTTGYRDVALVLGTPEHGAPDHAPFDRIIVTAATTDIPPAWVEQLTPDGRVVVPLRLLNTTRSLALDRDGPRLHGNDSISCHPVPPCDPTDRTATSEPVTLVGFSGFTFGRAEPPPGLESGHDLGAGLRLFLTNEAAPGALAAPRALARALDQPGTWRWTGIEIGEWEDLDDYLPLAVTDSRIGFLATLAGGDFAAGAGPVERAIIAGAPCLASNDSLAFRIVRRCPYLPGHHELGVVAHGPHRERTATELINLLHRWAHRRDRRTRVDVWPAGTPDDALPEGRVIDKPHTRVVVSWDGALT